ncbi:MAG TPA: ribosome silencing factor [Candidatus Limadaptatus stercorigallinarum]|uniref:Ribosomal silencing factor RsfS n=1 Tax=Candidatus Limadaptatus stercorigallinarum TaxID=2840845 RepID=A0A9D1L1X1_9FIRM|nr:ribosome silencing factor [Christensenellales bacterium]HIU21909.1 ribosome silencing factor [Candidatus Limadaptatus stercorigallinarum]
MSPEEIKNAVCKELDERKAVDITVLNVSHLTVVADYFVICTARSNKQVKALAEYVSEKLEDAGVPTLRSDGVREGKWAVLDFGSVIVHVFNDDTRMFYCLEKLWTDGDNVEFYPAK